MDRLFSRGSGNALIVAWAHGPLLGPIQGTQAHDIDVLAPKLAAADGILASPSMLRGLQPVLAQRDRPSLFVLAHWQSVSRPDVILGYEEGATATLMTVQDAARYGADGVMTYLYVGWADPVREQREVEYVNAISERCRHYGILHMVESRAVREETDAHGRFRADLATYHTRLAAELGADLVKTKWTDSESFRSVVDGCPVPVLVAGGSKRPSFQDALSEAQAILDSGARGLVWGRNIYQHDDPERALERLLKVAHGPTAPSA